MSDAEPVLSIRNLTVTVAASGAQVVRSNSFDIQAGETVCVVGESGSGKSVTSLSVMGLLPAGVLRAGGRVLLDGEDVLTASPARLRALRATRMAMVFQEPMTALNPVERVGAQIAEVLRVHGIRNPRTRRARVIEMMEAVHLPDAARLYDSYPHQLSGGQRQRIVICMALILRPRLLIADEPTTALDVTTQAQILALIRELQERFGTAVLFITHDFGVVAEIADRIVVMNHGQVVETGTREQILARPADPYTRMLVSSVPSLVPRPARRNDGAPCLTVAALDKTYAEGRLFGAGRTVRAVRDAHLSLHRGEVVGLVGESGSGKSTLARCIVRLVDPTAGSVRLDGTEIATMPRRQLRPIRRRIQIVFQDPYRSLNARLKVGESIIEGLLNYGTPRAEAEARARAMIALVGMPVDALARYPHQFSGGQRQRICIARALTMEPEVLVADEAVSALDVSVQAQVLELLEEIRARTGVAILFITHDLRVAARICDRILVMKTGAVVEEGPAGDVLTRPAHPYTRQLLAAAPGRDWDFRNFRPLVRGA